MSSFGCTRRRLRPNGEIGEDAACSRRAITSSASKRHAQGCRRCASLVMLAVTACSGSARDGSDDHVRVGSVAQPLTDTDGDGMDDDWETAHFGNLSQAGTADFDGDGMTNAEEYSYGFDPTVQDAFD